MVIFYTVIIIISVCILLSAAWALAIRPNTKKERMERFKGVLFAHRGLHDISSGIPENSLAAFRAACEEGYGAELDVRATRDGRLAVIHDPDLLRTAGSDLKVNELTAAELTSFSLEGTYERVPLLEQVISEFDKALLVEVKPCGKDYPAVCEKLCRLMDSRGVSWCVESFDPRVLLWFRKNKPGIPRGQLSMIFDRNTDGLGRAGAFVIGNLLINFITRPDFIAYKFDHRRNLSLRLCRRLWKIRTYYWTIKSPGEAEAAFTDGAGIIFEGFKPMLT